MDPPASSQAKADALEMIGHFRVAELQAVLEFARLPRQGYKRDLLLRCQLLISSKLSSQLAKRIQQIHHARINSNRQVLLARQFASQQANVLHSVQSAPASITPEPQFPPPNHIQFVRLPFYDVIRTIACVNMSVYRKTFPLFRFVLNDNDCDLITKGVARVFLRIAPTIASQRQMDVAPLYLYVQCNGQLVINNNVGRAIGAQAHGICFPTDLTEKLLIKPMIINELTHLWVHSPVHMGLKNLAQCYTIALQLVRCLSVDGLCQDILQRQSPRVSNISHERSSNNNNNDEIGLLATRQRLSLLCPITQSILGIPVKSSLCSHLTCFDLRAFLQLNRKRLEWTCPLCKKSAAYETLFVDPLFQSILDQMPSNCSTVEIDSLTVEDLKNCHYIIDDTKDVKSNLNNRSEDDCVVLSSGSESGTDADADDEAEEENNERSFTHSSSTGTLTESLLDEDSSSKENCDLNEKDFLDNLPRFVYDFVAEAEHKKRKRPHSDNPPLTMTNREPQQKRAKHTSTIPPISNDTEIIVLSSSDDSHDNADSHL